MIKAREDDRRIFTRDIQLNVLALQSSNDLDVPYLWCRLDVNNVLSLGTNESIFDDDQSDLVDVLNDADFKTLQSVIDLFEHAKTFGSLIQIPVAQADFLKDLNKQLQTLIEQGNSFQKPAAKTLMPFVQQAQILALKFDAVIANPPYMGNKYLNPLLKDYLKKYYKGFEKDLFSASMIRGLEFAKESGQLGFMSPFVWMFISSYEELRTHFIDNATLTSLIQLEYSGFDGATVPICTFTLGKTHLPNYTGSYIKLSDFKGHENQAPKTLEAIQNKSCSWFYQAKPDDFKKISGSPVAYWASDKVRDIFSISPKLSSVAPAKLGMRTGNNERFLRRWYEVSFLSSGFGFLNAVEASISGKKWFPYNKGGNYRRWYGNNEFLVNWENNGDEIKINTLENYPQL